MSSKSDQVNAQTEDSKIAEFRVHVQKLKLKRAVLLISAEL